MRFGEAFFEVFGETLVQLVGGRYLLALCGQLQVMNGVTRAATNVDSRIIHSRPFRLLYSLAPETLVGLIEPWTDLQRQAGIEKVRDLPTIPRITRKEGTPEAEAIQDPTINEMFR